MHALSHKIPIGFTDTSAFCSHSKSPGGVNVAGEIVSLVRLSASSLLSLRLPPTESVCGEGANSRNHPHLLLAFASMTSDIPFFRVAQPHLDYKITEAKITLYLSPRSSTPLPLVFLALRPWLPYPPRPPPSLPPPLVTTIPRILTVTNLASLSGQSYSEVCPSALLLRICSVPILTSSSDADCPYLHFLELEVKVGDVCQSNLEPQATHHRRHTNGSNPWCTPSCRSLYSPPPGRDPPSPTPSLR